MVSIFLIVIDTGFPCFDRFKVLSPMGINNYPSHLDVLKEALLRAIQDIDAKFSKACLSNGLHVFSVFLIHFWVFSDANSVEL